MGEFQEKDIPATAEAVARHRLLYKQQPYYKHFKGGWYRIDDIRNDDGVLTVYYTSMHFQDETGAFTEHKRPADEFFGAVEKQAYSGLRFWPHPEPILREDNPMWVAAQKKAIAST